jgi:hypothetical protein
VKIRSSRKVGRGALGEREMIENDTFNMKGELAQAINKLVEEVQDGLRHGFFEYGVTCELLKDRKRRLTIKAGKSHQFIIREEDLR